jgi:hypothetical protein
MNSENNRIRLWKVSWFCVSFIFVMALAGACLSQKELEEPPIITSATYQHTQYNGRGQPIEASAAKDDVSPFVVTYFTSEDDYYDNKGGSDKAPSEVGDYYARIERPAGKRYKQGQNIKVEYHIQKAFISVTAEPVQRFAYDGKPKEVVIQTEPPVEPGIRYFDSEATAIGKALAGPPVEKGAYRALLTFSGNERYMGASREIELLIE